jgi:flagellar biosynthesis/type III secretory pathway M-ring protein FliF/YscJ
MMDKLHNLKNKWDNLNKKGKTIVVVVAVVIIVVITQNI